MDITSATATDVKPYCEKEELLEQDGNGILTTASNEEEITIEEMKTTIVDINRARATDVKPCCEKEDSTDVITSCVKQTKNSAKVSKTKLILVNCPHWGLSINKINLKRYIHRRPSEHPLEITSTSSLRCVCLDPNNGLYAVVKTSKGSSVPLHVVQKTWGQTQVRCESIHCQTNADIARQSRIPNFRRVQLKSTDYCTSIASETRQE